MTALMWAASGGHDKIMEKFLRRVQGKELRAFDQEGNALMLPSKNGHGIVVKQLLTNVKRRCKKCPDKKNDHLLS